jgi:3-oxoacyl-[acyl-carrier protein] reductase
MLKLIHEAGGNGLILQGDLTQEEAVNSVVDGAVAHAGRLDILVNNAGALLERAKIEDCSLDLWNRTLSANLTSAFLVTRRAIPALRKSGKGAIINILSLSVQTGGANGAGAYGAAKGGLHTFTRTLARELAPRVRTNAVMPGVIETRHHAVASSAEAMENYRKQTPLARNGQAEEVANAVLYLASDASSFTNGALLDINGGRFLR